MADSNKQSGNYQTPQPNTPETGSFDNGKIQESAPDPAFRIPTPSPLKKDSSK